MAKRIKTRLGTLSAVRDTTEPHLWRLDLDGRPYGLGVATDTAQHAIIEELARQLANANAALGSITRTARDLASKIEAGQARAELLPIARKLLPARAHLPMPH